MAYRKHAPGKGGGRAEQELLYDPDVPTPTHAERARTLVAQLGTGTLCTVSQHPPGYPYGSFVTMRQAENSSAVSRRVVGRTRSR